MDLTESSGRKALEVGLRFRSEERERGNSISGQQFLAMPVGVLPTGVFPSLTLPCGPQTCSDSPRGHENPLCEMSRVH